MDNLIVNIFTRVKNHLYIKTTLFTFIALLIAMQVQSQTTPKPFITTWETTIANERITIPTADGSTYSYTVNWGDGSANTTHTGNASHRYATAGTYTVTVNGTFPCIRFASNNRYGGITPSTAAVQIRTVEKWGSQKWASMELAFATCTDLTIADDAGVPDLSGVTSMQRMFQNASLNGDISGWDVSSVTNMASMFAISSFNGDISEWNVGNVTNMTSMFTISTFNGDISKWNVSNVTSMNLMFQHSQFNGDISKWDVSSVTSMVGMFYISHFNGDISKWDVSSVTDMRLMLSGSSMSSENYDKLLIGWSTLNKAEGEIRIPAGIMFGAPLVYSCRGVVARDTLTGSTYSWNISGDELVPIKTDLATLPVHTAQCSLVGNAVNAPTAKKTCESSSTAFTATIIDENIFPIASDTTITWTYIDNGKSITQTQKVTITDTTDPVPGAALSPLIIQCEITSLTAPTATDNCDGKITATTTTATPITSSTTITWTYEDEAGNTATQTQDVTINDNMDPVPMDASLDPVSFQCPIDDVSGLTAPKATDNCDGELTATPDATFPLNAGTTTITWTYTDKANNMVTQTQQVTIGDTTSPKVTGALPEVTVQCPITTKDDLTAPDASSDNCGGVVTVALKDDESIFPITSSRTITWKYTDKANNTVTQAQQVTIGDTTSPKVTGALPEVTVQCPITTKDDLTVPDAPSDNCGGVVTIALKDNESIFPITMSRIITWTYTDKANNTATQTQQVAIDDTIAPNPDELTLPKVTAENSLARNSITTPTATDNCDGKIMATHNTAPFPITSNTVVTWTYTDAAGNTTTQTQQVTIAEPVLATDYDSVEVSVFPNPSGRYLEVQSSIKIPVSILDLNGKLLQESTTNTKVDIASLRDGLYFVKLPGGILLKFIKK